jgi:hypothetical protein
MNSDQHSVNTAFHKQLSAIFYLLSYCIVSISSNCLKIGSYLKYVTQYLIIYSESVSALFDCIYQHGPTGGPQPHLAQDHL